VQPLTINDAGIAPARRRSLVRALLRAAAGLRPVRARLRRLARDAGQGTVEYVGIVIAVGALLLALNATIGGDAGKIGDRIRSGVVHAIDQITADGKPSPPVKGG
jgi:hypothetical protein